MRNALSSGKMVARMGASVEVLMEQSQHFDGLLLEAFESGSEPQVIAKLFGEMFNQVLKSIWHCCSQRTYQTLGFMVWEE